MENGELARAFLLKRLKIRQQRVVRVEQKGVIEPFVELDLEFFQTAEVHDESARVQLMGFKDEVKAPRVTVNVSAVSGVAPLAMRARIVPKGFRGLDVHDCTS